MQLTHRFGAEPAGGWYAAPEALPFQTRDRKAELLAYHCRRRRYQVLVRFFDLLRNGQTTARGQLPCGLMIDVPPEIWGATNVVINQCVADDAFCLFRTRLTNYSV